MKLAVDLAREVMSTDSAPRPGPGPQQPVDLGTALAQQFSLIDRNMDAIVATVNAQNAELKRALQRQRIWNYALAGGILIAVVVAGLR